MTPTSSVKNPTKKSTSPTITPFKRFTSLLSQAIDYIQNYIDIVDTPLEDIINYLERLQLADNLDKMLLRKKILKRKNFLKRYRAKNRPPKIVCAYEQFSMSVPVVSGETEAETKKKRNRVSAQVSRDRKKRYFQELE